jgi:hypothetical protein
VPDWHAREALGAVSIAQLMAWNEAEFLRRTEGSAIRRIGHARWLRNVALAAGNATIDGVLIGPGGGISGSNIFLTGAINATGGTIGSNVLSNGILTNQFLGETFNLPHKDINLLMAAM